MELSSNLLADEFAEEIVTTVRDEIGAKTRSVTYFTRNDFEQLHLRSDLERDADLSTFVGHELREFKNTQNSYRTSELGDYRFTLRAFENGYLLRVAHERAGVLITTDGETLESYVTVANALKVLLSEHEHAR